MSSDVLLAVRHCATCAQAEEERRSLSSQVSRLQREVEGVVREKRELLARAGQHKAQGREAADALQVCTHTCTGRRMKSHTRGMMPTHTCTGWQTTQH